SGDPNREAVPSGVRAARVGRPPVVHRLVLRAAPRERRALPHRVLVPPRPAAQRSLGDGAARLQSDADVQGRLYAGANLQAPAVDGRGRALARARRAVPPELLSAGACEPRARTPLRLLLSLSLPAPRSGAVHRDRPRPGQAARARAGALAHRAHGDIARVAGEAPRRELSALARGAERRRA